MKMPSKIQNHSSITDLVNSNNFPKMTEELQTTALTSVEKERTSESGMFGKMFGTKKENMAINVAFCMCLLIFILCIADMVRAFKCGESGYTELVKGCIPVFTLTLGYIFGKGNS